MKKLLGILIIPISLLIANSVSADNTHTVNFADASSEYAYYADDAHFDDFTDMTIEFWYNATSWDTDDEIIAKRTNADLSWTVRQTNSATQLVFDVDGTGGGSYKIAHMNLPTGSWEHVAITYSSGDVEFYFDGVASTTLSDTLATTQIKNGAGDFCVGCRKLAVPDNFFDGKIDEVRLWSDVRTAQEISDYYDCQLVGDETNLVAYYQFNNDATDETTFAHDLTEVNTPTYQSASLPFTAECGGGGGATSTASSTIDVDLDWYSDDLTIIKGRTDHYESSTTAPDWTRYHYFHIPFLAWVIIFAGIFVIGSRIILEIIIRFRNGKLR